MRRFYVTRNADPAPAGYIRLAAPGNLITGERYFRREFGPLDSIESDMLLVASAVFAADRAYARGEREDVARQFELNVPVVNLGRLLPLVRVLEQALYRLSNDAWSIRLRGTGGVETPSSTPPEVAGRTLLFSGGLDSLAAAVQYGSDSVPLQLVSHLTRNRITNKSQRDLLQVLRDNGLHLRHHQCLVSSRSAGSTELRHDEENSQRTRSFVFLTLGALFGRRSGHREILFLAENGQMAIHLPLTHGRVGAFSTHTAHPEVLASVEAFLSAALEIPVRITNPYVHLTKKEVVEIIHARLPAAIAPSNSCWKNSRLPAGITHCGECVPCYVRRIAIECLTTDTTTYGREPWNEDIGTLGPLDDGRRNLVDLTELVKRFERNSNEEIMSEWPELYSDAIDADQVISMYRRFADEARFVLGRYPKLEPLLV
jgi:7-cyano-7-deazaguanine synthase in queuosine biosynthesis